MTAEAGRAAIVAALLANTGIAATKFVAWALTGASSMLAEAIHSVADAGNQLLLLIGRHRARRPPSAQHPFGYGRERYLYPFIVSIVLFSVGGLFALYEAVQKYREVRAHHATGSLTGAWWWMPLAVLAAASIMEGLSFRTAVAESNLVRGDRSWIDFVHHARSIELPVILLEDAAALAGLLLALAGVGGTLLTRNGYWDVAGTAAIGVLLVLVATGLAIETKSLLLGEAATPEQQLLIERALRDTNGVRRVLTVRTLHIGPEELLVMCEIVVDPASPVEDAARIIDRAEQRVRAAVPEAKFISIEVDSSF